MSIIRFNMVDAVCNRCGTELSEYTECCFNNAKQIKAQMGEDSGGWQKIGAMHFCPDCLEDAVKQGINLEKMKLAERRAWIKVHLDAIAAEAAKAVQENKDLPGQSTKPAPGAGEPA